MAPFSSIQARLRYGAEQLQAISSDAARDAALLLCHALGKDRVWLLTHNDTPVLPAQEAAYDALLTRRAQHEPMQYILGQQEFYGLSLQVSPAVLIPRPETEHLVEAVLERMPRDRAVRIVDVGTGSGAIGLALASALPLATIDALDISEAALAVAQANAEALELGGRVFCRHSDLLEAVQGARYDAVVSNPPYVASTETLEAQVQDWEPHGALFAGPDGLGIYRRLLPQALQRLKPAGLLALELGAGQQVSLQALFDACSEFQAPVFLPDLRGIPRVALSRKRGDAAMLY